MELNYYTERLTLEFLTFRLDMLGWDLEIFIEYNKMETSTFARPKPKSVQLLSISFVLLF